MLKFKVEGQILTRVDNFGVVADSINYLTAEFDLCFSDFAGKTTAIFEPMLGGKALSVILDENNACLVPHELIKANGFRVSLVCFVDSKTITTQPVTIRVIESGYVEGETPEPPTPSVYEQIIETTEKAKEVAQSVRDDADAGLFNATINGKKAIEIEDSETVTVEETENGIKLNAKGKAGTVKYDDILNRPLTEWNWDDYLYDMPEGNYEVLTDTIWEYKEEEKLDLHRGDLVFVSNLNGYNQYCTVISRNGITFLYYIEGELNYFSAQDIVEIETELSQIMEALRLDIDDTHLFGLNESFQWLVAELNEAFKYYQAKLTDEQINNINDIPNYVKKEDGKGLSSNDYTTDDKDKLSGIEENANYYVLPDDVVKDGNYTHTDNNFTTDEKQKLANLVNYDDTEVRQELEVKQDKTTYDALVDNVLVDNNLASLGTLVDNTTVTVPANIQRGFITGFTFDEPENLKTLTINYSSSGASKFVMRGDDCDDKGLFTPVKSKHYDLTLFYDGYVITGVVCGVAL